MGRSASLVTDPSGAAAAGPNATTIGPELHTIADLIDPDRPLSIVVEVSRNEVAAPTGVDDAVRLGTTLVYPYGPIGAVEVERQLLADVARLELTAGGRRH